MTGKLFEIFQRPTSCQVCDIRTVVMTKNATTYKKQEQIQAGEWFSILMYDQKVKLFKISYNAISVLFGAPRRFFLYRTILIQMQYRHFVVECVLFYLLSSFFPPIDLFSSFSFNSFVPLQVDKNTRCDFQLSPVSVLSALQVFSQQNKPLRVCQASFPLKQNSVFVISFRSASHLAAVLPRIDERQEDDFFRSASESDSFSSGEDEDVPAPDLREVKKKSKNKADSRKEKPPVSSKRAKPPEPAPTANEDEIADERLVAVKAENLFDISEGEEETEETPEGQDGENDDEKERFFQPEEENEESEDEDAKENSKKHAKRQRDNEDENSSESEEEKEEGGEDDKRRSISKRGSDHLKLITTSVSPFLNHKRTGGKSKKEPASQETGSGEEQNIENEETEEKENDEQGEEDNADKTDKEGKDEEKDEDEDEPRVEFTGQAKPEVSFCFYCVIEITLQNNLLT